MLFARISEVPCQISKKKEIIPVKVVNNSGKKVLRCTGRTNFLTHWRFSRWLDEMRAKNTTAVRRGRTCHSLPLFSFVISD